MPNKLLIAITLITAVLAAPVRADAASPLDFFGAPGRAFSAADPAAGSTQGGQTGRTAQSGRSVKPVGTKVRRVTRCSTRRRHGRRIKTCKTYVDGRLTKVCKKVGHRRKHCRARAASAVRRDDVASAASAHRRTATARAASVLVDRGFSNPALSSVVHLYCTNGCTTGINPHGGFCSSTLVRPGVVLPAGHCVYDNGTRGSQAGWSYANTDIRIVPGMDRSGQQRFGSWEVAGQWTTTAWQNGDDSQDWGLIVLKPDSTGHYAGAYTGTESAAWNQTIRTGDVLWNVGYPSTGPFSLAQNFFGDAQYFCQNQTDLGAVRDLGGTARWTLVRSPCEMGKGSSGGPLFAYSQADRRWYVVGVNNTASFAGDMMGFADSNTSVWFDDRFGAFWNDAMAAIQASGL